MPCLQAAQKQPSLGRQQHQAAQPQLQELVQLSHQLQAAQGRLQAQAQVAARATLGRPTSNLTLRQVCFQLWPPEDLHACGPLPPSPAACHGVLESCWGLVQLACLAPICQAP